MAASMVGKPLACDEATLRCSRMEYTRVCIELDAATALVHNFQVVSSLTEDPLRWRWYTNGSRLSITRVKFLGTLVSC
ncbi:hypothetical protein SADUNF_Sadunf10G0072300 [Salix dunnii]|uniref:Uncharacterized protein n=1 Tax=Salix dunnii TaxID=1413687 RepID=A0A835JP77_9ROSI|nr:hypothetical protein SADUNF_Sadunf10G0072300 [Salix dunnii]